MLWRHNDGSIWYHEWRVPSGVGWTVYKTMAEGWAVARPGKVFALPKECFDDRITAMRFASIEREKEDAVA